MQKLMIASALSLVLSTAYAADTFTDAMQQAYVPYRVALFKTGNGTQEEALNSVQQAQQIWKKISEQYASKAPVPYDRDAAFANTLQTVTQNYSEAILQVQDKQLTKAHQTLEKVRGTLAELRHRNQVIIYSDHMNAYHAVMEQLIEHSKKTLAESDGIQKLTLKAGALIYLNEKLGSEAPTEFRKNPEFIKLLDAQNASIAALQKALFKKDAPAIQDAISKLKMPYSKLFVKFG